MYLVQYLPTTERKPLYLVDAFLAANAAVTENPVDASHYATQTVALVAASRFPRPPHAEHPADYQDATVREGVVS